ncbi:hypothetical protein AMTR_s00098p00075500 [Amborella trichopoda]|uniref:Uncharacterized protein n=1 Tax=Amborella trichopoda TaxID=13333 RepID=W1NX11_AMBTC|nr:hypothetical protein AMTR_s00098p00075500 [Amborella trichopoda]
MPWKRFEYKGVKENIGLLGISWNSWIKSLSCQRIEQGRGRIDVSAIEGGGGRIEDEDEEDEGMLGRPIASIYVVLMEG